MRLRLLDLDGGVTSQKELVRRSGTAVHNLSDWGPRIRMSCRLRSFNAFEAVLEKCLDAHPGTSPALTFYGSGDFHHVSLALLRRIQTPFNVLVLDKHPDWMRGVPVLHCGTWLYHAMQLPQIRRIYHVGGDLDFDNSYRWLAPWPDLEGGKIKVFPAHRRFEKGRWAGVPHEPLRPRPEECATPERMHCLLEDDRVDLARWPLYVSLDKDVLTASDATVNWDSGLLNTPEIEVVLQAFLDASRGQLVGMDIVGDWSPVRVQGLYRRFLHWTEHPPLTVNPEEAAERNQRLNLRLLEFMESRSRPVPASSVHGLSA